MSKEEITIQREATRQKMNIRKYEVKDCCETANLFYETVHAVNAKDYDEAQLDVWAKGDANLTEWNQSFSDHYSVVTENNGAIVGFGDIDRTGYLDRLYVHKDYQGQGIATMICNELERNVSTGKIFTHASITAKPFFIQRGYCVVKEQQVIREGIMLTNYVMEKQMAVT